MRLFRSVAVNLPGVVLSLAVLPLTALCQADYAAPYTFITLAGNSGFGYADGTGSAARFAVPLGVAADSAGNLYVADTENNAIRKMALVGTNWVVTTIAGLGGINGSADGPGSAAQFNNPWDVTVDGAGSVYVADTANNSIRKVTPVGTNWVVTTLAGVAGVAGTNDGTGSAARFNNPAAVAVDSAGNVYVADEYNYTIRKVTPVGTNWVVTTLAGLAGTSGDVNGMNAAARFSDPRGVAVDRAGNVYVADELNNTIRTVTPVGTNWVVSNLAGQANSGTNDGKGYLGMFYYPRGVAVDSATNVYVADTGNSTIRKVTPAGVVTTLAGLGDVNGSADGTGSVARFNQPRGLAVDSAGVVYVADSYNNTMRQVTPAGPSGTDGLVATLAGLVTGGPGSVDGTGSAARFNNPLAVAVDNSGNAYVADTGNNTIREVTPVGVVTTLAGLAGHAGGANGTGSAARFNEPSGIAVDSAGNLYVGDFNDGTIRKVTPVGTNWVATTLVGVTGFSRTQSVAVDGAGNLYVADPEKSTIREVALVGTNWVVTTLAGLAGSYGANDGTGSAARFDGPDGIAVDSATNIYVADWGASTIRKLAPVGTNWVVTTLAGSPYVTGSADGTNGAARFSFPQAVAVDRAGNVYVADAGNNTVRKLTPSGTNWVVTTVGGVVGILGWSDGTGISGQFSGACGLAVDSAGDLYVADSGNNTIRKGFPASSVPPPILQPPSLSAGQFGFGITGLPGLAVYLESSDDLFQWQIVGTRTLEGGTNYYASPNPLSGAQFYRSQAR